MISFRLLLCRLIIIQPIYINVCVSCLSKTIHPNDFFWSCLIGQSRVSTVNWKRRKAHTNRPLQMFCFPVYQLDRNLFVFCCIWVTSWLYSTVIASTIALYSFMTAFPKALPICVSVLSMEHLSVRVYLPTIFSAYWRQ